MARYDYQFFFMPPGGTGKAIGTGDIQIDWQGPYEGEILHAFSWSQVTFKFTVNSPAQGFPGQQNYYVFQTLTSQSGGNVTIAPGYNPRVPSIVVDISDPSPAGPVEAWVQTVIAGHGTATLRMLLTKGANTWSLINTVGVGIPATIASGVLQTPINPLPVI